MNTHLIVRLPEEQKMLLKVLADNRNVSVAEITRQAIREYFVNKGKKRENFLFRLAKIGEAKKPAAAPKDLSENYKDYLYGKKQGK